MDMIDSVLPDNVKEIGPGAFDCPNLCSVTLPNGFVKIHVGFGGHIIIIIPEGVTEIGDEVFCNYSDLRNIFLPKSLVKIGDDVFRKYKKLTIHAPAGSYAETYAKENGIRFIEE